MLKQMKQRLTRLLSEGRESRSRLGLETEGTETLGLVSVSYKILELVSSRLKNFETASSRLFPFYSVSSLSRLGGKNFMQSCLGGTAQPPLVWNAND